MLDVSPLLSNLLDTNEKRLDLHSVDANQANRLRWITQEHEGGKARKPKCQSSPLYVVLWTTH